MTVPIAGDCQRVDREDWPAGGPQAGDEEPARCLDRHGDRGVLAIAMFSQQGRELGEPRRVVTDPHFGELLSPGLNQGYVVVAFGPVHPTEHWRR